MDGDANSDCNNTEIQGRAERWRLTHRTASRFKFISLRCYQPNSSQVATISKCKSRKSDSRVCFRIFLYFLSFLIPYSIRLGRVLPLRLCVKHFFSRLRNASRYIRIFTYFFLARPFFAKFNRIERKQRTDLDGHAVGDFDTCFAHPAFRLADHELTGGSG